MEGEGDEEKVSKRGKRISQRGEQRRMERERERGLGGQLKARRRRKRG